MTSGKQQDMLSLTIDKKPKDDAEPKPQELLYNVNYTDETILTILKSKGDMTRNDLVDITGIPRSTLYDALLRLILKGKVSKYSERINGPGRPKVFFKLV